MECLHSFTSCACKTYLLKVTVVSVSKSRSVTAPPLLAGQTAFVSNHHLKIVALVRLYCFTISTDLSFCPLLSAIASIQRSEPKLIVCVTLSTTSLELVKLEGNSFGLMLAQIWTHVFLFSSFEVKLDNFKLFFGHFEILFDLLILNNILPCYIFSER